MIRVMVVGHDQLICAALGNLIGSQADIEVAGVAGNICEATERVMESLPDVTLVDLSIPDGGVAAVRSVKRIVPDMPILAVTRRECSTFPNQAIRAGAKGCLTSNCRQEDLWQAIRDLALGHPYMSPRISQWLSLGKLAGERTNPFDGLSQRQVQVLMGIINGYQNSHIAADLCLSPKTVSNHKSKLFARLQVKSQAELVRLAIEHGMDISPGVVMLQKH